jgi:hypothetical protein
MAVGGCRGAHPIGRLPLALTEPVQPCRIARQADRGVALAVSRVSLRTARRIMCVLNRAGEVGDDAVDLGEGVAGELTLGGFGGGVGFFEVAEDDDLLVVEGGGGVGVVEIARDDELSIPRNRGGFRYAAWPSRSRPGPWIAARPGAGRRSRTPRWCTRRVQPVVATPACWIERSCSSKTSAGVRQPRILRGRLLSARATASRSSAVHLDRSVPFGKY